MSTHLRRRGVLSASRASHTTNPASGPRSPEPYADRGRMRRPIKSDGTGRLTLCPLNGVKPTNIAHYDVADEDAGRGHKCWRSPRVKEFPIDQCSAASAEIGSMPPP